MKNILITCGIVIITILAVVFTKSLAEVNIKVQGGSLSGTIIKSGADNDTIVLLIAGSGPTDRDGNSDLIKGRNDSLLQLSQELSKNGIDTFRFDKRTAGESIGNVKSELNFNTFVNDVVSCIKYLKAKGYTHIYLAGHSQGSLVGMVAAQKEPVSGLISIAGPAQRVDYALEEQLTAMGKYEDVRLIIESLRQNRITEDIPNSEINMFSVENQKFLLSWMKYAPLEEARKLNIPLLFINGDADTQVKVDELNLFRNHLPNAKFVVLKNTNHVFKIVENDDENVESYTKPWYRLNSKIVENIMEFVASN